VGPQATNIEAYGVFPEPRGLLPFLPAMRIRIESLNMSLRKTIKTRDASPPEDAALKMMYLVLKNLAAK
jgi:hypothetical protein